MILSEDALRRDDGWTDWMGSNRIFVSKNNFGIRFFGRLLDVCATEFNYIVSFDVILYVVSLFFKGRNSKK